MTQRTHELWAVTAERGEFLVYVGPRDGVERVAEDLQDLLDGESVGYVLVKLPSNEILQLTMKDIGSRA